jgi:hypothetical protein
MILSKMSFIKTIIAVVLMNCSYSFAQTIVDTIDSPKGKILVYSNRSWEYMSDANFDGIMNDRIHDFIDGDPEMQFIQPWDNHDCFPSDHQNDLSKLKDTLWLCVADEAHKDFVIPFNGVVTSRYGFRGGRYHNGIDIDVETGDSIVSAWDGKVRYAEFNDGGFGNLVIVRHYNGLETIYAHLSKIDVTYNQEVKAGELLGLGGNTGRSRGSHLHFEIRFYDAPINPEEIINFDTKTLKDENLLVHKAIFRPGAKPTDLNTHDHDHAAEATAAVVKKAKAKAATTKSHRVRAGETLSQIAAKYGTTIGRICKLNGIRANRPIQAGRTIRVK